MQLHNVILAEYIEPYPSTAMKLMVDATVEQARETFSFIYNPDDIYGLTPDVTAWFMVNPDFPISPYVPPEE